MLIRRPSDIPAREITPEPLYLARRDFLKAAGIGLAAVGGLLPGFQSRVLAMLPQDELTPY